MKNEDFIEEMRCASLILTTDIELCTLSAEDILTNHITGVSVDVTKAKVSICDDFSYDIYGKACDHTGTAVPGNASLEIRLYNLRLAKPSLLK